jgi:CubicO group peptidase (beta-lactamase class C family)
LSPNLDDDLLADEKLSSTGPKPVTDRDVVTAGAGGIYSTPIDMTRYLAALLGGGANEHGTVLKPATLAAMFAAQFQPDPRISGIGLRFGVVPPAGIPWLSTRALRVQPRGAVDAG